MKKSMCALLMLASFSSFSKDVVTSWSINSTVKITIPGNIAKPTDVKGFRICLVGSLNFNDEARTIHESSETKLLKTCGAAKIFKNYLTASIQESGKDYSFNWIDDTEYTFSNIRVTVEFPKGTFTSDEYDAEYITNLNETFNLTVDENYNLVRLE